MYDHTILHITNDKRLTPAARHVVRHLHDLAVSGADVVVSYNEISKALGYCRFTCVNAIKRLEHAGYLTRQRAVDLNGKALPNTFRLISSWES